YACSIPDSSPPPDAQRTNGEGPTSTDEASSPSGSRPRKVMWVKGSEEPALVLDDTTEERYPEFRSRAFQQRDFARPGETPNDMKSFCESWSPFFLRPFTPGRSAPLRRGVLAGGGGGAGLGLIFLFPFYGERAREEGLSNFSARHYREATEAANVEDS